MGTRPITLEAKVHDHAAYGTALKSALIGSAHTLLPELGLPVPGALLNAIERGRTYSRSWRGTILTFKRVTHRSGYGVELKLNATPTVRASYAPVAVSRAPLPVAEPAAMPERISMATHRRWPR